MSYFTMQVSDDGVAVIRFDVEGRTMNTLTHAAWTALSELVEQIVANKAIRGAVITSGKENGFCAGADLNEMIGYAGKRPTNPAEQQAVFDELFRANRISRRIETCGKPFAAAVNGLALGGGLELALACHYRVVTDDPQLRLGLPEATIGLLPGGGGTQRVTRLLGITRAMPILLEGKTLSPDAALQLGLIDALAPAGQEVETARSWIVGGGEPIARWDRKEFALPGGGPYHEVGNSAFIAAAAGVAKTTFGNYPAQSNIARAVYEGVQVPMDKAILIETRYFVQTLQSTQAKAMIRTLFGSYPALRKRAKDTRRIEPHSFNKVAVLGAGMMGAGIAYVLAHAGIRTVLLDVNVAAAEKGKDYSRRLVERSAARSLMTRAEADALLARIHATDDFSDLSGSDAVIETVFEDIKTKADVTRKALAHLAPDTLFASNTSTLPIGILAKSHNAAAHFIGMHFHSPVNRMELVEVVVGKESGAAAVTKGIDLVRKIGKTAIIAQDSPFFYTSRVFDTYIREGMEMMIDGVAPIMIDQVGKLTGMPRGPLELTDDVAIDLVGRIATQRVALLAEAATRRRSDDVIDFMIAADRLGRKNGRGFYDYSANGSKELWSGLGAHWPVTQAHSSPALTAELRRRFLHRQAIEAARCLSEGVLDDARHADVGAILGWGFPRWTGGPLSYIEQIGVSRFVDECDELAQKWGSRFSPPDQLREMGRTGNAFYPSQIQVSA